MGTFLRMTGAALLVLALVPAAQGAGEFYLYEPKPVDKPAAVAEPGDGVLIKNITIKRGDTLSGLSRKYAGKGSYFPQILLFNEIMNPNLIYAGKELKVPVTTESGLSRSDDTTASTRPATVVKRKKQRKTAVTAPVPVAAIPRKVAPSPAPAASRAADVTAPPVTQTSTPEQKLYEKAIAEYRASHYGQAHQTFATFLDRYPSSPLAPDAALYKAECLLKQAEEPQ
jgi:LysM repeat protein